MRRTQNTQFARRRPVLVALLTALTIVGVTNATAAQANTCDGSSVVVGQSGSTGNPVFQTIHTFNYPNPSGEFTMPTSGALRYLSLAGRTGAEVRFIRESVVARYYVPTVVDSSSFAHPGDRFRVDTFYTTTTVCGDVHATLGWINFV
jgi:hypothetical protein